MSTAPDIDKTKLYGRYQDSEDRRAKLGMKMAYKALDIPDDDVQINVDKSNRGLDWRGLVAIGAMTLGGMGMGTAVTAAFLRPTSTQTQADTDTDTLTEIEFVEPVPQ